MLGVTLTQRVLAVLALLSGAAVTATALLGQADLARAGTAVLLTAALLVLLDLRRRSGEVYQRTAAVLRTTRPLLRQQNADAADHATNSMIATAVGTIRKVAEATATEAQAASCDIKELKDHVTRLHGAVGSEQGRQAEARREILATVQDQTREVEALFQLFARVSPDEPMPPSGRWALAPTGLLNLYALVARYKPRLVVELGSGTSTVWLGHALAGRGDVRLVSVDHLAEFAGGTRLAVERHGLTGHVEVRHAPLTATRIGDEEFRWYDAAAFAGLDRIDLLLVDGPPGTTGREARYPAVPALHGRLAEGALVVLDDANRSDEKKIVQRWIDGTPGLERVPTTLGEQAVLRYQGRTEGRA